MVYGAVQKTLKGKFSQENILIESPFIETTRNGIYLSSVILALSPTRLILACPKYDIENTGNAEKMLRISIVCPLDYVKVDVFKRTKRQTLRVTLYDSNTKYFELKNINKRKIFWDIWCQHVEELSLENKLWPFINNRNSSTSLDSESTANPKDNKLRWLDKDLYMGTKREIEDVDRPTPIPGLGPTEDIKLNYLKPEYFGCWDQSEHWVQCESSTPIINPTYDCELCTYTGEPTSNINYTSIMTAWK